MHINGTQKSRKRNKNEAGTGEKNLEMKQKEGTVKWKLLLGKDLVV